jgi:two-component system, NtrC family, response regulator HydG
MSKRVSSTPESTGPVLLVDDDPEFLLVSGLTLRSSGISPVMTVEDSRRVIPLLVETDASVVVLDLKMPFVTGEVLLGKIREEFPEIPVIVMTGMDDTKTAVECMKGGAFDYLVKPVERSRFVSSVRKALEMRALRGEISSLKKRLLTDDMESKEAFSAIVTRSKKMHAVFRYLEAVVRTGQPILITGETGVGKELVARAVHRASDCRGTYVPVNVAGLDDAMFSDTLFGHTKGAFTGAAQARDGLVAHAADGTLFLDEIGDLAESSQVKLLRLLEERQYYPLGSDVPRMYEGRIVCATAQNLQERMGCGRFRKDLYYRLSGHQVRVPSLRERPEDIPVLVDRFLEEAANALGKRKPTLPKEILTLLSAHDFPGNVRELKTLIFDAAAKHRGGVLSLERFRQAVAEGRSGDGTGSLFEGATSRGPVILTDRFPTLLETERFLIFEALKRAKNNQGIAATLLGISRQALNKRLQRDKGA